MILATVPLAKSSKAADHPVQTPFARGFELAKTKQEKRRAKNGRRTLSTRRRKPKPIKTPTSEALARHVESFGQMLREEATFDRFLFATDELERFIDTWQHENPDADEELAADSLAAEFLGQRIDELFYESLDEAVTEALETATGNRRHVLSSAKLMVVVGPQEGVPPQDNPIVMALFQTSLARLRA